MSWDSDSKAHPDAGSGRGGRKRRRKAEDVGGGGGGDGGVIDHGRLPVAARD